MNARPIAPKAIALSAELRVPVSYLIPVSILFRGFPPMTVRTPNIALFDFRFNLIPRVIADHFCNVCEFFASDVVELKANKI